MDRLVATNLAHIIDDAIAKGVEFRCEDWEKSSVVNVKFPVGYPDEDRKSLKAVAPQGRYLVRVRELSRWLAKEYEQFMHGESYIEAGRYGDLNDLLVRADRLLRSLYGFEGCIWGDLGCDKASPSGYMPARCERCVTGSSRFTRLTLLKEDALPHDQHLEHADF